MPITVKSADGTMKVVAIKEKKVGYKPKSKSDKWATPRDLYDPLDDEFEFNYDPCPIDWKVGDADGLTTDWGTRTFCNPPYSIVAKFIKKAHDEWKKGKTVVMLINVITDTAAFHDYIYGNAELRFIRRRVKFIDTTNPGKKTGSAPVGSMLCIFRADSLPALG